LHDLRLSERLWTTDKRPLTVIAVKTVLSWLCWPLVNRSKTLK
jgi:hypothetical protein